MPIALTPDRRGERIGSVLAVAIVHALIGAALIFGLNPTYRRAASEALKVFDVTPPPPPPPQIAPTPKPNAERKSGAAAPPNKKATPSPVVVPPPIVRLPPPPAIVAAPVASAGALTRSGAAPTIGPGTGAGGAGNGTGSGDGDDGDGDGDIADHARLLRGEIRRSDYPDAAYRDHAGGTVSAEFTVGVDGRASGCRVVESSGRSDLDGVTCRLIEQRFRYRPARDARGRLVPERQGWEQRWWLERRD